MTTTKISAIFALTTKAITNAKIITDGARTAIRNIPWYACCKLLVSVVSRVTKLALEKLSIFSNENC